MTPAEVVDEFLYPFRSLTMSIVLVSFFLLLELIGAAGVLGVWLAVIVIPALFRFYVMVAEARASGADAEPPGIELFTLGGNLWTLFPVIPTVLFVLGLREVVEYGVGPAWVYALLCASIYPAMIAVLVITHSPAQALNPLAWLNLVGRLKQTYLLGPIVLVAVVFIPLGLEWLPRWSQSLLSLFLTASFYALVGAMLREQALIHEVDIPAALVEPEKQVANLEKDRLGVLNHAYGFASRGNRAGALSHIESWLASDPDPDAAWSWFFDRMLCWEQKDHALFFAQRYVGRLLERGDRIGAVKVIMRGQLVNERFRPAPEHMDAAIEAAEATGNSELASALNRL